MALKTLLVRPRGTALVPNYEAEAAGRRSFVGRQVDASTIDPAAGNGIAFVPVDGPVQVPASGEYLRHILHGDLWAADQATADHCGIKFDPTFGGAFSASKE